MKILLILFVFLLTGFVKFKSIEFFVVPCNHNVNELCVVGTNQGPPKNSLGKAPIENDLPVDQRFLEINKGKIEISESKKQAVIKSESDSKQAKDLKKQEDYNTCLEKLQNDSICNRIIKGD